MPDAAFLYQTEIQAREQPPFSLWHSQRPVPPSRASVLALLYTRFIFNKIRSPA